MPICLTLYISKQALLEEAHNISQLTKLQRVNFIRHLGLVSLLALAGDFSWCEGWSCCLVQSRGDLVDVVQTNHGEDEATGQRQKDHGIARADTSFRERIHVQDWEYGKSKGRKTERDTWRGKGGPDTITIGSCAKSQGDIPLTKLSGTYQVVTQTRWMRPDAKRANRRQRRTKETGRDKESGGSHNGNTRHLSTKPRNQRPSESWETCLEGIA